MVFKLIQIFLKFSGKIGFSLKKTLLWKFLQLIDLTTFQYLKYLARFRLFESRRLYSRKNQIFPFFSEIVIDFVDNNFCVCFTIIKRSPKSFLQIRFPAKPLIYTGYVKIGTRTCHEFRWKSQFFDKKIESRFQAKQCR